jgi:CubicO group peptidase (beta-lactamase class C family)
MRKYRRFLLLTVGGVVLLLLFYVFQLLAAVGTGYKAKLLATAVFHQQRQAEKVLAEEFDHPFFAYINTEIDHEKKTVIASVLGIYRRTATFDENFGAILDYPETPVARLAVQPTRKPLLAATDKRIRLFPDTTISPALRVDLEALAEAAFYESDSSNRKRTRALLIARDSLVLLEKYGDGINAATPLLGWSMSKSITNTFFGMLAYRDLFHPNDRLDISEWQGENDPRHEITADQLLRMRSGLAFFEGYGSEPHSDVTQMLFNSVDAGAYAADLSLEHEPGSHWYYSSGTSNILSRAVRNYFPDYNSYWQFAYGDLFTTIGMQTMLFETDGSGTFVGSSFAYATARDWTRFGLLYLWRGSWNGTRLFSEDWVDYTVRVTPGSENEAYGAHFWLPPDSLRQSNGGPLPDDLFYAAGHYGQFVTIIPSLQLVVVRLGQAESASAWDQHAFIARVVGIVAAQGE